MSHLKVYDWEWKTFPLPHRTKIKEEFRELICREILDYYKIKGVRVAMDYNSSGGRAMVRGWDKRIRLPMSHLSCNLDVILHEVAHHLDYKLYKGEGHRISFKKALIKVYCEMKPLLPKLFARVRAAIAEKEKIREKKRVRYENKVASRERAIVKKSSRAYRIALRQKQIKALETRKKRTATAIKKARRSLAALERAEARAKTDPQVLASERSAAEAAAKTKVAKTPAPQAATSDPGTEGMSSLFRL